jgi:tetratricopeptide (TPR) repeat protein
MKNRKLKVIISLAILALLLTTTMLTAQDWRGKGRINGTVSDVDGNPLVGVEIKCLWVRGQSGKTITSGKDGKWALAAIKGGPWNLDFIYPDHMTFSTQIHVSQVLKAAPIKVVLEPAISMAGNADLSEDILAAEELFEAGDFAAALPLYVKAQEDNPTISAISYRIADCMIGTDDYAGALELMKPILEENPNSRTALRLVGDAAFKSGDYQAAFDAYDVMAELAETDAGAWANLGEICFMVDQYPRAVVAFGKAIEFNPEFYDGYVKLAVVMQVTGDMPGALAVLNKLKETAPEDDPIFAMYPVDSMIAECEAAIG